MYNYKINQQVKINIKKAIDKNPDAETVRYNILKAVINRNVPETHKKRH